MLIDSPRRTTPSWASGLPGVPRVSRPAGRTASWVGSSSRSRAHGSEARRKPAVRQISRASPREHAGDDGDDREQDEQAAKKFHVREGEAVIGNLQLGIFELGNQESEVGARKLESG